MRLDHVDTPASGAIAYSLTYPDPKGSTMLKPRTTTPLLVGLFLASVIAANWMIANVGTPTPNGPHVLPVGFGLSAPSAVYVVGITLVLRDVLQRRIGWLPTGGIILLGAGMTFLFAPALAFASAVAFLVSELVDFALFSALQRHGMILAVAASNAVSIVVDSVVFLSIAFSSLAFMEGQVVGKAWATLVALGVLLALQARRNSVARRERDTVTA